MKRLCSAVLVAQAFLGLSAATVKDVVVRQDRPWSTQVKVSYVLEDVSSPVNVKVRFFTGATELTPDTKYAFGGDGCYGLTAGTKTLTFDPVKLFGTTDIALGDFKVRITAEAAPENINEVIYRIYDLKAVEGSAVAGKYFPVTDVTRADLLNGKYGSYETEYARIGPGFATSLDDVLIWTGVTNDLAYKTDKLVMRRISAAGKSFQIGKSGATAAKATVNFANDYWMAVFETTAYQFKLIFKSATAPFETNRKEIVDGAITVGDICAADMVAWTTLRNANVQWPEGKHSDVKNWCTIQQLQAKSNGQLFDFPTSAEWEFAARAGTTTALPSGKAWSSANMAEIGRMCDSINCITDKNDSGNATFPSADCSIEHGAGMVGQYRPNAFGLYDTMGNVLELCLDNYNAAEFPFGGTDPKGSDEPDESGNGGKRVMRGGSYRYQFNDVGMIGSAWGTWNTKDFGFRICLHEVDK